MLNVRSLISTAACWALVAAAATPVQASMVTGRYTGQVTDGSAQGFIAEFPRGTAVSWSFDFDNAFLGWSTSEYPFPFMQAVSGWLQMGGSRVALDRLLILALQSDPTAAKPDRFAFSLFGPAEATAGGGLLVGLTLELDAQLDLLTTAQTNNLLVFEYPNEPHLSGATTQGTWQVVPAQTVPVPATPSLVLVALAACALLRQRRGAA